MKHRERPGYLPGLFNLNPLPLNGFVAEIFYQAVFSLTSAIRPNSFPDRQTNPIKRNARAMHRRNKCFIKYTIININ